MAGGLVPAFRWGHRAPPAPLAPQIHHRPDAFHRDTKRGRAGTHTPPFTVALVAVYGLS